MRINNSQIISRLILLVIILTAATSVQGQIIYGLSGSGDVQIVYSSWKVSSESTEETISQFSIPLGGFIPIKDNFEARFYIANAFNKLSMEGNDISLSGLGDVRLQLNHSFAEDQLLLSGGINLPTGKKKLDPVEEKLVLEILSENYLQFPIRRLGEGFGFNLLAGGAIARGNARYGASLMYQLNGSYKPYEGQADYKPGNFFSASASADLIAEKTALSANLIFTVYSNDKLENEKVFKQSSNVDMRLGGQYNADKYDLLGSVRYMVRGRSARYNVTDGAILSQLKAYGNEFSVFSKMQYYPDPNWYLGPSLELKMIAANEEGVDSSTLFGAGAFYGRKLNENINFNIGFKYYTGSADGGNIDISGYQINANLMTAF